jgi:hypothetical protein
MARAKGLAAPYFQVHVAYGCTTGCHVLSSNLFPTLARTYISFDFFLCLHRCSIQMRSVFVKCQEMSNRLPWSRPRVSVNRHGPTLCSRKRDGVRSPPFASFNPSPGRCQELDSLSFPFVPSSDSTARTYTLASKLILHSGPLKCTAA